MKTKIKIKYQDGNEESFQLAPADYARWEKETGRSTQSMTEPGLWDFLFLAYSAYRRIGQGNGKPFEIWMDTVADFDVDQADPKATVPVA